MERCTCALYGGKAHLAEVAGLHRAVQIHGAPCFDARKPRQIITNLSKRSCAPVAPKVTPAAGRMCWTCAAGRETAVDSPFTKPAACPDLPHTCSPGQPPHRTGSPLRPLVRCSGGAAHHH